jgi:hypothetical protein
MTYQTVAIEQYDTQMCYTRAMVWRDWKRFKWLEKRFKRWWYRLSDVYVIKKPMFQTVEIDSTRILELVLKSKLNIKNLIGRDCRHVIIGPKQLHEIEREIDINPLSFGIREKVQYRGKIELIGLTVHCIPWFDGVLLLPELEEKGPPEIPRNYRARDLAREPRDEIR